MCWKIPTTCVVVVVVGVRVMLPRLVAFQVATTNGAYHSKQMQNGVVLQTKHNYGNFPF